MNKYALSFPDLIILEGRIYVLLIHHQPKDAHLVSPRRLCVARGRGDSFYSIATCTEMGNFQRGHTHHSFLSFQKINT